jgi:hypothetical protein
LDSGREHQRDDMSRIFGVTVAVETHFLFEFICFSAIAVAVIALRRTGRSTEERRVYPRTESPWLLRSFGPIRILPYAQ